MKSKSRSDGGLVTPGTGDEWDKPHRRWILSPLPAGLDAAAVDWNVSPIVAHLLMNRGLAAGDRADSFLNPRLTDLLAPELLPGAAAAAELMVDAVKNKRRIVIYGDYDVDGTTGVAILWHMLVCAGASPSFYVPHRVEEGYGLNPDAVERLAADGAELVITVDCGITAIDEVQILRDKQVTVIVTDHHTPPQTLPNAHAIVHPAVGGEYPNPDLCGASVAFKLAWAFAKLRSGQDRVKPEFRECLMDLLPLAALGTIADVVSLRGENRIIAKNGLAGLGSSRLPGIRALIDIAGLKADRIDSGDVGFKLAPRINAAGRMGHARLAVELLTRADADRAREIALYLDEHNRARRSTERKIFKKACEIIDHDRLATDARRAIVVACDDWHPGVIGIVASRIVERYRRPTVLISLSGEVGQGSCRSISAFDVHAALEGCREHLLAFGGHPMAAGLRIAPDRIDAFTEAFVAIAGNRLTGADLEEKLYLDSEIELAELTLPASEAILSLGPFGKGNPRPKFATGWLDLADEPRCVGANKDHLQVAFSQNGFRMKGIGFGMAGHLDDLQRHRRCRVAFQPIINDFNGRRTVEMQLIDFQFPT